jgi:hypothetical protein
MSDVPWDVDGDGFTATFKAGKGYEEPWLVIRAGSADTLKDRVISAFGLDEDHKTMTLAEVISNANQTFHALGSLSSQLGGRVITKSASESSQINAEKAGDDPWIAAAATASEPVDPEQKLLDEIEAATTVDQLKRFWVANNPLSAKVQAAWSAKGKSLS